MEMPIEMPLKAKQYKKPASSFGFERLTYI